MLIFMKQKPNKVRIRVITIMLSICLCIKYVISGLREVHHHFLQLSNGYLGYSDMFLMFQQRIQMLDLVQTWTTLGLPEQNWASYDRITISHSTNSVLPPMREVIGRDDKIWTHDILYPKQMRYQAYGMFSFAPFQDNFSGIDSSWIGHPSQWMIHSMNNPSFETSLKPYWKRFLETNPKYFETYPYES